jgi:hypothetical protein
MKAIRLIIAAVAAAFAGLLIADNQGGGPQYHVTVLHHVLCTVSTLDAFVSGLALALVFGLALGFGFGGKRR